MHNELDKIGAELEAQRFQMLRDIAKELSGEIAFPTSFDVLVRLRNTLADPSWTIDQLTKLIGAEPMIAARLVGLANSAAVRAGGSRIVDLKGAISLLGLNTVRTFVMAMALDQIRHARLMSAFNDVMQRLWKHSLRAASAAYVVSKQLAHVNPEEAMLAGLIHDIGAFYLLYRAAQYDDLRERPDSALHLVIRWHEAIGYSMLVTFGLPEEIADAVREHDAPREIPTDIYALKDVIYVANILAGGVFEWQYGADPRGAEEIENLDERYTGLIGEIDQHEQEILALFA